MYTFFMSMLIALLYVYPAAAISVTVSSNTVTINYLEPTKLIDNRDLTDLVHTTIYPVLRKAGDDPGIPLASIQVPASAAVGGGAIQHQFEVSASGDHYILEIRVTATRDTGVESVPSVPVHVLVDHVQPSAPE